MPSTAAPLPASRRALSILLPVVAAAVILGPAGGTEGFLELLLPLLARQPHVEMQGVFIEEADAQSLFCKGGSEIDRDSGFPDPALGAGDDKNTRNAWNRCDLRRLRRRALIEGFV